MTAGVVEEDCGTDLVVPAAGGCEPFGVFCVATPEPGRNGASRWMAPRIRYACRAEVLGWGVVGGSSFANGDTFVRPRPPGNGLRSFYRTRMKTLTSWAVLAGIGLVVSDQSVETSFAESGAGASVAYRVTHATQPMPGPFSTRAVADLTEVVQQYCVDCHSDRRLRGNLSLEGFSVENASAEAETAEKMIRKLRAGMMPPPGRRRPAGDTLMALVEALETDVDEAAVGAPRVGVRRFQRLSRAEYEHVMVDLFALEVDAGKWLPPDVLVGSFDNMSAAQALSTTLLDSYLRAAADISRLAIGNPTVTSSTTKHGNPMEVSQHAWDHIGGTPFGTRGGMVVTHDFPADGEYVFQIATAQGQWQPNLGGGSRHLDRRRARCAPDARAQRGGIAPSDRDGADLRSSRPTQGIRRVRHLIEGPYEDRFSPPDWSRAGTAGGGYGVTGLTHLTELLITGPRDVAGVSDTESRTRIFTCYPAAPSKNGRARSPSSRSWLGRRIGGLFRTTT